MSSVLITGTSKGIGFETALVMPRAGHTIYATMRNPGGSRLLAETAEREGLPIRVSAMDVDSDASVRNAFEQIHASGGNIDVLVNNDIPSHPPTMVVNTVPNEPVGGESR